MEIKEKVKIASLWVLALCLPIFWHDKAQNPFLFSKELFFRFYVLIPLGIVLWKYNKFFSLFLVYSLGFTFLKLSTRSLWALGNLRDFFLFYLILRIFLEKINWRLTLYPYLISLGAILTVSYAQLLGFDVTNHGTFLYSGEYWKIAGFFGNTHILTTWIGICTPVALLLPLIPRIMVLGIIGITLSVFPGSGGISIALLSTGTGFLIMRSKEKKINLGILANLIFIVAIISWFNESNIVRSEIMWRTLLLSLKHPIVGRGFNTFGDAGIVVSSTAELQAHNDPLQFLYEFGIVIGSIGLSAFLVYYVVTLTRIKDMTAKAVLSGLFYGFIYYSNFSFPFHMAHTTALFLTVIAVIDAIKTNEAQKKCEFSTSQKTLPS